MSLRVHTKTPELFYAHGSTRCGNLIGCSGNFANKLQVRKTAPLEHSLRAFSSAALLRLCNWRLSVNSSVPMVSCWGCVVSFVAMRPLQACTATLCYVLKVFLCLQRGQLTATDNTALKSVFKLREDVCVWVCFPFESQYAAVTWQWEGCERR